MYSLIGGAWCGWRDPGPCEGVHAAAREAATAAGSAQFAAQPGLLFSRLHTGVGHTHTIARNCPAQGASQLGVLAANSYVLGVLPALTEEGLSFFSLAVCYGACVVAGVCLIACCWA